MWRFFALMLLSMIFSSSAFSADFNQDTVYRERMDFFADVVIGQIRTCHIIEEPAHLGNALNWAKNNGLIENSTVTNTMSFSGKILSKGVSRKRVLVLGCWRIDEMLSEDISGQKHNYALSHYEVSDFIRNSPILNWSVCIANTVKESKRLWTGQVSLGLDRRIYLGPDRDFDDHSPSRCRNGAVSLTLAEFESQHREVLWTDGGRASVFAEP